MRAAYLDRIVPVSLELGGKSPSIVFPDANEDWVIDGIIAAMRFTRQSPSPAPRARASSSTATSSTGSSMRLGRRSGRSSSAIHLDEASDIGTVINEKQFRKVCGYVEEGLSRREARVVIGGPAARGRAA